MLDVLEALEHGLGRHDPAAGPKVPLQVADPEHDFRDGGGAGVDLEPEELVRVDGVAVQLEQVLAVAELLQQIEHLAFQALEVLHGDVEEIAGAAGRVENAQVAEFVVEVPDRLGGGVAVAHDVVGERRRLDVSQRSRSGSITAGMTRRSTQRLGVNSAPSLRRSRGSSACSRKVPKIAGSTSRQSALAASIRRPRSSGLSGSAARSWNSPPLKRSTASLAVEENGTPRSISPHSVSRA